MAESDKQNDAGRTKRLNVPLSPEEKQAIRMKTAEAGISSMAEFARRKLLEEERCNGDPSPQPA